MDEQAVLDELLVEPDEQLASTGVVYGFEPVRHLDAREGRSM
ncbi:hypothetical protein ACFQES_23195 [Nonomuraea salmonea]